MGTFVRIDTELSSSVNIDIVSVLRNQSEQKNQLFMIRGILVCGLQLLDCRGQGFDCEVMAGPAWQPFGRPMFNVRF